MLPRSCQISMKDSTGKIKSPNYPGPYPASTDCRWTIKVDDEFKKIRLFFAIFDTQNDRDTLFVRSNSIEIIKLKKLIKIWWLIIQFYCFIINLLLTNEN